MPSITTPDRSLEQRLTALEYANEVRSFRAALKRDLKAGRVDWRDVLVGVDVDERLATMKVYDLLLAVPKVGRSKADRALHRHRISPSKTIGGLSGRQRAELAQTRSLPGIARYTPLVPADR
jgi:hypothetical protein